MNFIFTSSEQKYINSILFQTEVDELTSGVLVREGKILDEDITQSTECKL